MSKKPKYLLIKETLLAEIESGKFLPGDLFYTENELKEKFQVSSITVLRAVSELVQDRYLIRIQGKGTFVKKDTPKREVKFTEYLNSSNDKVKELVRSAEEETLILSVIEMTDKQIAKELKVEETETLVHFKRVRKVGNVLWALQNNYIPKKYIPKLDVNDQAIYTSIADRIFEDYGIDLVNARMNETISVLYPAPEAVGYLLDLDENAPVYHFKRKTFVEGNRPFEFIETFVRYDYYSIEISN